jgi:hypothetical protein
MVSALTAAETQNERSSPMADPARAPFWRGDAALSRKHQNQPVASVRGAKNISVSNAGVVRVGLGGIPMATLLPPPSLAHGARMLPSVEVDSYNRELKVTRASSETARAGAPFIILDNWRKAATPSSAPTRSATRSRMTEPPKLDDV